jgi:hypothetical protein
MGDYHDWQKIGSIGWRARGFIGIYIGYGFGGTYGKYSRTMAEHLAKHIPGNPKIIVKSQPGAGGIKMTNYAYKAMPRGGYHLLMPPDTTVVSELLRPKKVKYRAKEFTWLGSSNQTNTIFVVRADSGVKKWQDMKTKRIVVGNTGPGSTSFLIPRMAKQMLGLKIKQVSGYKGSSKTILAMEQGEHQGTGFNWLAWSSKVSHWFKKDKNGKIFANAVLQTGVYKDPDLPNVPMIAAWRAEESGWPSARGLRQNGQGSGLYRRLQEAAFARPRDLGRRYSELRQQGLRQRQPESRRKRTEDDFRKVMFLTLEALSQIGWGLTILGPMRWRMAA